MQPAWRKGRRSPAFGRRLIRRRVLCVVRRVFCIPKPQAVYSPGAPCESGTTGMDLVLHAPEDIRMIGKDLLFYRLLNYLVEPTSVSHPCESHINCRPEPLPAKNAGDNVGLRLLNLKVIYAALSFLVRSSVACCRFDKHASCCANRSFNVWQRNTYQGQLL